MSIEGFTYHKRGQTPRQFFVNTIEVSVLLRSGDHVRIYPDHTVVYNPKLTDLSEQSERVIVAKINMPPDKYHDTPWEGRIVYMPNQGDHIALNASDELVGSRRPERISITASTTTPNYLPIIYPVRT